MMSGTVRAGSGLKGIIVSLPLFALAGPLAAVLAADAGARNQYVRVNGLPVPYATLTNPLEPNGTNIAAGAAIYLNTCKSCHGATGKGDGENGFYYTPRPTDLTFWSNTTEASLEGVLSTDPYLFWTISEGEAGLFETGMPAFKSQLSETERWQLVLFIRQSL